MNEEPEKSVFETNPRWIQRIGRLKESLEKVKPWKMDPEIKARWAEAMRSGKYRRHRASLRSTEKPNACCCLGVFACEFGEDQSLWESHDPRDDMWFGNSLNYLPSSTTGAKLYRVPFIPYDVQQRLAEINDMEGATMEEIAQVIETFL